MPAPPPWLKNVLVSLGAGVVSTGVWISTAKNRNRKARKKKKKKDVPVIIGTVAKTDAAMPTEPALTLADMKQGMIELLHGLRGQSTPTDKNLPTEVIDKDGKVTPVRRRRQQRRKRKRATWMDSARESLRQTVREEVQDTVDKTGLGKAQDALQQAAGVAKDAAKRVQDALPEDVESKLKETGKTIATQAKKVGAAVAAFGAELSSRQAARDASQSELSPQPDASPSLSTQTPPAATDAALANAQPQSPPAAERIAEGARNIVSWVQGPGAPGQSTSSRRTRGSGDVVDAKD
jgi:hypothetical protein